MSLEFGTLSRGVLVSASPNDDDNDNDNLTFSCPHPSCHLFAYGPACHCARRDASLLSALFCRCQQLQRQPKGPAVGMAGARNQRQELPALTTASARIQRQLNKFVDSTPSTPRARWPATVVLCTRGDDLLVQNFLLPILAPSLSSMAEKRTA